MKEANLLIQMEKNINPDGAGDRYRGWVVTLDPDLDLSAEGATPGEVRNALRGLVLRTLRAREITAEPPPRTWEESLRIKVRDDIHQKILFK